MTGRSKGLRVRICRIAPRYPDSRAGLRSATMSSISRAGCPEILMLPCMDRLWNPWARTWVARVWASTVAARVGVMIGWSMSSNL